MTLPSTQRSFSPEQLYTTPGDMTLLGLAVAARESTLEGIRRGVPELTATGYDASHVALIEAFAVISAQVAYRAENLPMAVIAAAFELLGIARLSASAAVVDVFVDNPSSQDVFWVEGSLVGAGKTVFEVASTIIIPAGATQYGPVAITCLERGPSGNIQATFPSWNFVTVLALANINNPQPGQGGAWAETDAEYIERAAGRFAAAGTGNREADLLVIAQETPGIQRALVVPHARLAAGARWAQFPWAGANWGDTVYEQREGSVTVVARPYGGGYLSTLLLSRLSAAMAYAEAAGVRVGVSSCEEVPVDVALQVLVEATYDIEAVRSAAQAAVTTWLAPASWPWAGTLNRAALAAVVARVAGVRAVSVSNITPAVEKEDSVSVSVDTLGANEAITPKYPHVLLAARAVTVTASRA